MPQFFCRPAFLRALLVVAHGGARCAARRLSRFRRRDGLHSRIDEPRRRMTRSSGLTPMRPGKRYERNPGEKTASIEYARALRAQTRYGEAVAVIQTAAIKAPKDFDLLGEYGKALADAGQLPQAEDGLSRRLHARCAALGRHVGSGERRRPAWRSCDRHAILSRRAENRAGRAGCSPIWGFRSRWPSNCRRPRTR